MQANGQEAAEVRLPQLEMNKWMNAIRQTRM